MSVLGIICEYNPFHAGHAEHIAESKAAVGADSPVVCVMSGDFVQRGTPAVYNKHIRAKAACAAGADLVLELPLPWSIASAERFARGGVGLLNSLGVVTHLCFGSESGDLAPLTALALAASQAEVLDEVKAAMESGMGFAPARQMVLEKRLGKTCSELLEKPNNILGVEYIKAIFALGAELTPVTSRRTGSMHDGVNAGERRCASEIRTMLEAGEDASAYIPASANAVFAGCESVYMENLEQAYMARLRCMSEADFNALPDAGDGLGSRVHKAVRTEGSVEALLSAVKTKRYAMSRLRRMLTAGVLGVTAEMQEQLPPYARVLAANETGRKLLRDMDGASSVPLITKPASVRELDENAQKIFSLGANARDFYALGSRSAAGRRGGTDWKTNPAML